MRHLIDPMDLSVEEINHLLDLADDIILHKEKYQEVVSIRNQRLYFLNQVQEPDLVLKLP